uniref:Impact N-terminal domain-containing protein n=1 Tax=Oncorhynchus tshawytscha TaxID=74940 RepID=A0AAZ3SD56_ONCTS
MQEWAAIRQDVAQKLIDSIICVILNFWPRLYGDKWCVIDEAAVIFCIKIIDVDHPKLKAYLQVIVSLKCFFRVEYDNNYSSTISIIISFSHMITRMQHLSNRSSKSMLVLLTLPQINMHKIKHELPPIKQGGIITDRRSTFQPQLPTVVTPRQLLCSVENRKSCFTFHHKTYCEDKQSFLQDREDDGDTAAGGQLLHLLQVLFSVRWLFRWYGGILLGPDHFKHINNSARNILVQEGYTSSAVRPSLPISNVSKFGTSPH